MDRFKKSLSNWPIIVWFTNLKAYDWVRLGGIFFSCVATCLLMIAICTEYWVKRFVRGIFVFRGLWTDCQLGHCSLLGKVPCKGYGIFRTCVAAKEAQVAPLLGLSRPCSGCFLCPFSSLDHSPISYYSFTQPWERQRCQIASELACSTKGMCSQPNGHDSTNPATPCLINHLKQPPGFLGGGLVIKDEKKKIVPEQQMELIQLIVGLD